MSECTSCAAQFPYDEPGVYVDIYGICYAGPCQRWRDRMIARGDWFSSTQQQKEWDERHEIDSDFEAVLNLVWEDVENTEQPDIYGGLRACVTNEARKKCVEDIIKLYKSINDFRGRILQ